MGYVDSFMELEVYKRTRKLSLSIFELTKQFPREETYSLIDQYRRASRSIGSQIAEAWGKRRYESHFVSKLTDSDSEQFETQHWTLTSFDCGYISETVQNEIIEECLIIGRMLQSMIDKSGKFCK